MEVIMQRMFSLLLVISLMFEWTALGSTYRFTDPVEMRSTLTVTGSSSFAAGSFSGPIDTSDDVNVKGTTDSEIHLWEGATDRWILRSIGSTNGFEFLYGPTAQSAGGVSSTQAWTLGYDGSGVTNTIHGAYLVLDNNGYTGIVNADRTGSLNLMGGNGTAQGATIEIGGDGAGSNSSDVIFYRDNLAETIRIEGTNGDLYFTEDLQILAKTTDGSDNRGLFLNAGGSYGNTRGAGIGMYGNESAAPGSAEVFTGDIAGADLNLYANDKVNLYNISGGLIGTFDTNGFQSAKYTQLGTSFSGTIPAFAVKSVTGTWTANTTSVSNIAHGLTQARIKSVTCRLQGISFVPGVFTQGGYRTVAVQSDTSNLILTSYNSGGTATNLNTIDTAVLCYIYYEAS